MYWLLYVLVFTQIPSGKRIDFIREIVDNIDIDIFFPRFPGAPDISTTVRSFLDNVLHTDEFDSLHIQRLCDYSVDEFPE